MGYAVGKKAKGVCDRCGFTYLLSDLKYEIEDQKRNGLRVCFECLDEDQPQLQLGKIKHTESISLFDPRPNTGKKSSRSYYAFDPIGGGLTEFGSSTMGLKMTGKVGKLTVSTS
tara:strand:- start:18 stop:359 length:342 start_codon:yes stop_codon:yes gene_type:complete